MSHANADIYSIILAAGSSSRLGRPKQLVAWQGQSLLEHAINHAQTLTPNQVIVVLGAYAEAIQAQVKMEQVIALFNPDWHEGIAASIRVGIGILPPSAKAALILLCDQPFINRGHLQAIVDASIRAPNQIIASEYRHSLGVPALFPASCFGYLSGLQGDRGAKALLLRFCDQLVKIALPEAEVDIDTPSDLEQLSW